MDPLELKQPHTFIEGQLVAKLEELLQMRREKIKGCSEPTNKTLSN